MLKKPSTAIAVGAAGATLAWSTPSSARDEWMGIHVSPGVAWTWTKHPIAASGRGFELTAGYSWLLPWMLFKRQNAWAYAPHVAAFFRTQRIDDDPNGAFRWYAAGVQGGAGLVGFELGYASRGAVDERMIPAQGGVVVSPFVSLGILYAGPQWFFPVSGDRPELAVNLGLKFPVSLLGVGLAAWGHNMKRMPAGRPLRIDGHTAVAPLVSGSRWRRDDLDAGMIGDRDLAEHWLREALAEHASIATFARLSLELVALGATSGLVAECHRAAADEARHAQLCFAVAAAYGAEPLDPGPLGASLSIDLDLVRLATESFVDGSIGEAIAAAIAGARAATTSDEQVRGVLEIIARDEARHAELGWAIVEMCLSRGDHRVMAALRLAMFAARLPAIGDDDACDPSWIDIVDRTRAAAAERLERLLTPFRVEDAVTNSSR
jgi:hypothetical protein